MIRKYKDTYGVILPRGGGVKRFKTEKEAKQFMLACGLFEDVWPSDDVEDIEEPQPIVTNKDDKEIAHDASGEDEEAD